MAKEKKEVVIDVKVTGTDTVKSATDSFGLMDTQVGKGIKTMMEFGKGIKALATGVKGFLIGSGIGIIVLAVAELYNYFQKTEKGAELLNKGMKVLGQVIKEGPKIAFNSLKFAVLTLYEPLNTLLSTFKNFALVLVGKKSVKEAIQGVTDDAKAMSDEITETGNDIVDASKRIGQASSSLANMENELAKNKRKNLVEEAKLSRELAQTKLIMDDATKTELERLKEIEKASLIQQQITDSKIQQAKDELAIANEKIRLGDKSQESLDAQAEAEKNLIMVEAEGADKLKEFADKKSAIEQKGIDNKKKAAEEKKKIAEKEVEDQKKLDEKAAEDKKKLDEKALEDLNKKIDAEIEADIKAEEKRLEIEKSFDEDLKALQEENYLAGLETDEERELAQLELDRKRFEERLVEEGYNAEQIAELKLEYDKKYNTDKLKLNKENIDKENQLKLEQARFAAQILADGFNLISEIAGKSTKLGKAAARAGVIANAASAIIGTWMGYSPAGFLGTAAAIVQTGMITSAAAKSLQSINTAKEPAKEPVQPPRYALGGWINGSSHQDGGVNLNAEGGEFIVNKRTMANPYLAKTIMNANAIGNGSMAGSGMVTPAQVAEIAAQVVKSIPVNVVESEISNKQRTVQVRESRFVR